METIEIIKKINELTELVRNAERNAGKNGNGEAKKVALLMLENVCSSAYFMASKIHEMG